MSGDERDRRPDGDAGEESQDRRLQRERKKAPPEQHDAATGPGYTARPTEQEPEEGSAGTSEDA
jgi:hypothetical protein